MCPPSELLWSKYLYHTFQSCLTSPCNNLVIYVSIIEDPGKIAQIKPNDEAWHVCRKQKFVLHLFIYLRVGGAHVPWYTCCVGVHMCHTVHMLYWGYTCATVHVWVRGQHAGLNSLLQHVNPEAQTRVFSHGSQCSLAEPSCQPCRILLM